MSSAQKTCPVTARIRSSSLIASPGVQASGMARRLLETRTNPDSVSGQVAQPPSRFVRNQRWAAP